MFWRLVLQFRLLRRRCRISPALDRSTPANSDDDGEPDPHDNSYYHYPDDAKPQAAAPARRSGGRRSGGTRRWTLGGTDGRHHRRPGDPGRDEGVVRQVRRHGRERGEIGLLPRDVPRLVDLQALGHDGGGTAAVGGGQSQRQLVGSAAIPHCARAGTRERREEKRGGRRMEVEPTARDTAG